jgi:hypothetical protein
MGQIVGSYEDSGGFIHGFLLSNGLYATLDDHDPLATGQTFASDINDMGQIVGYYRTATGFRGFLLYRIPEIVTRGRFPDGGESDSTWRTQEARHVGSDTIASGF